MLPHDHDLTLNTFKDGEPEPRFMPRRTQKTLWGAIKGCSLCSNQTNLCLLPAHEHTRRIIFLLMVSFCCSSSGLQIKFLLNSHFKGQTGNSDQCVLLPLATDLPKFIRVSLSLWNFEHRKSASDI